MPAKQFIYYIGTCFNINEMGSVGCCPQHICELVGQQERCATTNKLHWQFMVTYKAKCTLTAALLDFPAGTHLEPTMSKAARQYCLKDETSVPGTRFAWGKPKVTRKRDWTMVWELAAQGRQEEIEAGIRFIHQRRIQEVRALHLVPQFRQLVNVLVWWGVPGSGKSYRAHANYPGAYWKSCDKWWDTYQGEKVVIVDDFAGEWTFQYWKRITDKYPLRVEYKGGTVGAQWDTIIFTSNQHPHSWWPGLSVADMGALDRRISSCEEFREEHRQS